MSTKFEMSDLGKLTYYLGNEVIQHEGGIVLKQERYASKILGETGMEECHAVHIPMDSGLKLSKAQKEMSIDEKEYRRNIGCLRYLLHTCPDLSYVVGVLSRYMQEPKESHGAALKQVLRYLRGTLSHGLTFNRVNKDGLVGYSVSSHNVDVDDGKSTTGDIFYLDDCPINLRLFKCFVIANPLFISLLIRSFMRGQNTLRMIATPCVTLFVMVC
ncbi:Retrovirus-related Pol polyprotein from transposon RE1 [Cardamine amara subsp. amara]|uniref:Retrovirus-related Pol polyprotein from transposon RE1 n=1 Tax=Cardamine amara subsp. amara TaxID=228776 RepID=A0ABD0ZCZ9_CARAN